MPVGFADLECLTSQVPSPLVLASLVVLERYITVHEQTICKCAYDGLGSHILTL